MTIAYIISLLYLTLGIVLILLGLIILKENPRQRIHRITGVMMFFAGTGPIFGAFGLLLQAFPETGTVIEPFRRIFVLWEFFFPTMLLFAFVFPREIQAIRKHRIIIPMIFLPHIVHTILVLTFSSPEAVRSLIDLDLLVERFGVIIQPITLLLGFILSLLSLVYRFHTNFFALVNLLYIILAVAIMIWGYGKLESPRKKRQVGLVLWGIRASVGLYAIAFLFPHLNILRTSELVSHLLTSIALLIGAGSIAWAIIRYQFLDIRLIIRRGLIFSFASALLIGFYLLIYSQGKRFVPPVLGERVPILEIIFIILALLFFQPALGWIERIIEKWFMKDRLDYRNVIQNLSRDILTTLDTDALRMKITLTLQEALSIEHIELLYADRKGHFILHQDQNIVVFRSSEPWLQELGKEGGPLPFDELSLRVNDEKALHALKSLRPFLLIPFLHRNRMMGVLILGEKGTRSKFSSEDMTILNVLSHQAAIALENAQLYEETLEKQRIEEELGLAREIQKNLLPNPSSYPSTADYELTGYNLPSKEVGGDYFDFINLDETRLGIAIGDIAGKGIPAALLMSNLQAALRISALRAVSTQEVVRQINVHITKTTSPEKFATFFYSVFDTHHATLEYTNAGHNYPILYHDGTVGMLREGGVIIGLLENAQYKTERIKLASGDALVLYTDGITEALNPDDEEFGEHRLLQTVERITHLPAQGILDHILECVIDFTHGYLQSDDITLAVLKVK